MFYIRAYHLVAFIFSPPLLHTYLSTRDIVRNIIGLLPVILIVIHAGSSLPWRS
jgi:hypothetical protein